MGKYDFDKYVERKHTNCIKYDLTSERGMGEDTLCYWVADMDFETLPEIGEAIRERTLHNIYGYSTAGADYYDVITSWMERRHGWKTEKEWYLYTPGVVFALGIAVRALTEEGGHVMIQRPVYYPFSFMAERNGRVITNSSLVQDENGVYRMNYEDFEKKIVEDQVKLFILCNPHNPVGRVWTRQELERIGDICVKHGVYVVSDEIHEDFVRKGKKHIPFASIKPEFADITLTCTAPSKTFNLAGLQISNLIASNPELRAVIKREIDKTGYDEPNIFGTIACKTAYLYGEEWLTELLGYLEGNVEFLKAYLSEFLPKVKLVEPEGTYLAWIDFREYGLCPEELDDKILKEAGLWLDGGSMFGEEGNGFQRVNLAATREYLKKGLDRLKEAFAGL